MQEDRTAIGRSDRIRVNEVKSNPLDLGCLLSIQRHGASPFHRGCLALVQNRPPPIGIPVSLHESGLDILTPVT